MFNPIALCLITKEIRYHECKWVKVKPYCTQKGQNSISECNRVQVGVVIKEWEILYAIFDGWVDS